MLLSGSLEAAAQQWIPSAENSPEEADRGVRPLFTGHAARPLRYRPEGTDFVIENGAEFFNRPLYCNNSAFRIDAGDKPEFSLYLPGRGGNLRLGIRAETGSKWLAQAEHIVTRYRAGSVLYEVRDPLLGEATLYLTVLPMDGAQGLLCSVEIDRALSGISLIWAYGGVSGEKGQRGGDIGCERVPVNEFFRLKPQYCEKNKLQIEGNIARVSAPVAEIVALCPVGSLLSLGDAEKWDDPASLAQDASSPSLARAVLFGQVELKRGKASYLALQRVQTGAPSAYNVDHLPGLFRCSQQRVDAFLSRVRVETPDAYLNAAVPALVAAADGIWDGTQQAVMHGGVAWRVPLAGWRGPYAFDDLGWHDRLRAHLRHWAARQNVSAFEPQTGEPDSGKNGATKENLLHSRGDVSHNHYDMNLVYVDALMRHLLWTGDVEFAREMWPVIERHLEWERRLFRRTWGKKELPLYEAYACIWASDNLQYNGGGAAHSSAYNYFQNRQAARIAQLIGKDSSIYTKEADALADGIQQLLWLPDEGCYAESKDLLADQVVHPHPALWTFYHVVDCEVPDPAHAYLAGEQILSMLRKVPVEGPGVPEGSWFLLPCSDWMPYVWSLNLLVQAENAHAAHALWQSGHSQEAYGLFMGAILDSMYMGLCPGNLHMTSALSVHRQEAQRDFGDAIGTTTRALIEGLFGIHPDMLEGVLHLEPRFPLGWDHASIEHRDLSFGFKSSGLEDVYKVRWEKANAKRLRLVLAARTVEVESVTVDGKPVQWRCIESAVAHPQIAIETVLSGDVQITVRWWGAAPEAAPALQVVTVNAKIEPHFTHARLLGIDDPQSVLTNGLCLRMGLFTVLARVRQGSMQWLVPLRFKVEKPIQLDVQAFGGAFSVHIQRRDSMIPLNRAALRVNGRNFPTELHETAKASVIPTELLLPGTNRVELVASGKVLSQENPTDWNRQLSANGCAPVDLSGILNERVSSIFERRYLSPRSQFCSLSIPEQGAGGWAAFRVQPEIDDSGLMAAADGAHGVVLTPQGIPLRIDPHRGNNIAFVSQWSLDPARVAVPVTGYANHIYLLMAGSTTAQTSRMVSGRVRVRYADGSMEQLELINPENWWPIEQDYLIDDYQFYRPGALPPRLDLKTGRFRILDAASFKGRGREISGGAATLLDLPLDPGKMLAELSVEAVAYEPVIGLLAATLVRPTGGDQERRLA